MNEVMQQLASGQLTAVTIIVWTLVAFLIAIAGGAAAGWKLGAKDLGGGVAALIGGMYGPVAAAPGVLAGLIVLACVL